MAGGQILVRNSSAEPFRAAADHGPERRAHRDARRRAAPAGRRARQRVDNAGNVRATRRVSPRPAPSSAAVAPGPPQPGEGPFGRRRTARSSVAVRRRIACGPARSRPRPSARGSPARGGQHRDHRRHGPLSFSVPAGPSRALRLVFPGGGDARAARARAAVRVRGRHDPRSRTALSAGPRVLQRPSVHARSDAGDPRARPCSKGHVRGKWHTFSDTHTARGRWRVSYRFVGRPGAPRSGSGSAGRTNSRSSSATRAG